MTASRQLLLAGVSSIALAFAAPAAMAADLPVKAPPPVAAAAPSPWTWWVEGGAQGVGGDPFVPALNPPFDAAPARWGWDIAGGFDYRFDVIWHLSADFRYGSNGPRHFNSSQRACASTGIPTCFTPLSGANSATRKETNWVADFMIGRDIGLGLGNSQIQGGVRIAEIRGKTDGVIAWATLFPPPATNQSIYSQSNYFFGVGPRVALEGNDPLSGPWSIDYEFGVAGLFAHRSTSQTAVLTKAGFPGCFVSCPINASTSSNGVVFNPDAMLGIAYAISATTKISLNYHVDAYFDALRVYNSAGAPSYTNRIYHGPSLRLTMQY